MRSKINKIDCSGTCQYLNDLLSPSQPHSPIFALLLAANHRRPSAGARQRAIPGLATGENLYLEDMRCSLVRNEKPLAKS